MTGGARTIMTLQSILRGGFGSNSFLKKSFINGRRFMYSDNYLGIKGYLNARTTTANQFQNVESLFREKMQNICNSEDGAIFSEDLKAMLYLVEKTPNDIELMKKMMIKYHNQFTDKKLGVFVFGPVVMRALYYLNLPDEAYAVYKNPELNGFFSQFRSYQVLMTLLYNHGKYEEVKEIYSNYVTESTPQETNRAGLLIMIATCFKQNTEEALNFALDIWAKYVSKNKDRPRRSCTLLAMLAMKQNKPDIALEIVSSINTVHAETISVKALAYTKLKKFPQLIAILRLIVNAKDLVIWSDVIQEIETTVLNEEFEEKNTALSLLGELNQISRVTMMPFEDHLTRPILFRKTDLNDTASTSDRLYTSRAPQNFRRFRDNDNRNFRNTRRQPQKTEFNELF